MSRRVVVLTAGLSVPSSTRLLADQLADAVTAQVGARGERLEVEVVEVRDLATDLATVMTTGVATPALARAHELVAAADGLIAVTPVFSASYSGLFKMFVDSLGTDALNGVPVLVGATAGSARHSLVLDHAMRPLFSFLRAVVLPTGVFAASEDFGDDTSGLRARIARAASELAAAVVSDDGGAVGGFGPDLAATRPRRTGGELAAVPDFRTLLSGHTG